jgi:hypothetical protein
VRQSVGASSDLLGPAVTVAHRLLKNTIRDEIGYRPYLFLTKPAASALGLPDVGTTHGETYADAGTIEGRVLELDEPTPRATAPSTKLCDGCKQPLDPAEQVCAGFEFITRPSSSGKGTYRQTVGPSVTHPSHWPPMGGSTPHQSRWGHRRRRFQRRRGNTRASQGPARDRYCEPFSRR